MLWIWLIHCHLCFEMDVVFIFLWIKAQSYNMHKLKYYCRELHLRQIREREREKETEINSKTKYMVLFTLSRACCYLSGTWKNDQYKAKKNKFNQIWMGTEEKRWRRIGRERGGRRRGERVNERMKKKTSWGNFIQGTRFLYVLLKSNQIRNFNGVCFLFIGKRRRKWLTTDHHMIHVYYQLNAN